MKEDLIKKEIKRLYGELKNPRNDGWVQKGCLERLLDIKGMIDVLNLEHESSRFLEPKVLFKDEI